MADYKKRPDPDRPGQPEDYSSDPIKSSAAETATDVMRFLAEHAHSNIKPESDEPETVLVAGQEVDPKVAYKNLKEALSYLSPKLPFSLDDLYFKKFPGDIVGESTENGAFVDPLVLMHPSRRAAHVFGHEIFHDKGAVPNDSMIECYLATLGFNNDGAVLTKKYTLALENFHTFIERIADGRPVNDVVKQVYNLYYTGKYEAIYNLFDERYILKLKSHSEQEKAFQFFKTVFPELEVTNIEFGTKKLVRDTMKKYESKQAEEQSDNQDGNAEEEMLPPTASARPPLLN